MITAIDGLVIEPIAAADSALLGNLSQLYVHDMSAFFAGSPRLDLGDDGCFVLDPPLDRWWRDPGHVPMLLRWHGRPAGFALLNDHSVLGDAIDHAVAEFFVVRKYRRLGLGAAAAQVIFGNRPGRWELAIMRANAGAVPFWDTAIRGHPGARDIVAHDRQDDAWNGTVYCFGIAPP